MKLFRQRKPLELEMAQPVHPLTGEVRQIPAGEVAQRRAEADREFKRLHKAARGRVREH
jgi:hypothetical protein